MSKKKIAGTLLVFILFSSCTSDKKKYPVLSMTGDEIVHAMVEMYTINAAVNINDVVFQDSTAGLYFEQLSKISGKSVAVIKEDFEKLLLMPDSLLVLQNKALDTLRAIQDKTINKPTINIGIN